MVDYEKTIADPLKKNRSVNKSYRRRHSHGGPAALSLFTGPAIDHEPKGANDFYSPGMIPLHLS